jgi:IclR family acetate operon transcriptional repressor
MTTARDRPPEEAAEDTSFARGLRLLLAIADRGAIRADELGTLLDMPTSTVYRYLRTLADFGFVDRRGGVYELGPRLLIGGGSTVSSERLIRHADPILRMLVDETGETAMVMRRVGLAAVCLSQVDSSRPLRVSLEVGGSSPLHAGAAARVLLAFAPPEILEELVGQGLQPLTPATPAEAELQAGLRSIAEDGIAMSVGELVPGSISMAVPLLGDDGIVGALAVIGPEARCSAAWRARTARLLPFAAEELMGSLTSADGMGLSGQSRIADEGTLTS